MENLSVVKGFEASDNLNEDIPNLLLFDVSLSFLVAANFLKNIAIVSVLHDQTI